MPHHENFQPAHKIEQPDGEASTYEKNQDRTEQSGPDENHPESLGHPGASERLVLVDGTTRGLDCDQLDLSTFSETSSFHECYFSTDSGNIYALLKYPSGEIFLADARSNVGRGAEMRGTQLTEADLSQAGLQVGKSLKCKNFVTTVVKEIIVVTDAQFTTGESTTTQASEIAQEHTEGRISTIRRQFKEAVHAGL